MDDRLVFSAHPGIAGTVLGGTVPSVNNLEGSE